MQVIENLDQLTTLQKQSTAIIFLWVSWSMLAHVAAEAIEQFISEWDQENPDYPVNVYRIDVSEQSGELWEELTNWLSEQNLPDMQRLLISGSGSMLWARSGDIVSSIYHIAPLSHLHKLTHDLLTPNR